MIDDFAPRRPPNFVVSADVFERTLQSADPVRHADQIGVQRYGHDLSIALALPVKGVELVADRATKAPFDASRKIAGRIKTAAFNAGLICYPMSGTIDGQNGDHVLLAPPFIISDDQIDELVSKLSVAIDTVLQS